MDECLFLKGQVYLKPVIGWQTLALSGLFCTHLLLLYTFIYKEIKYFQFSDQNSKRAQEMKFMRSALRCICWDIKQNNDFMKSIDNCGL